MEFPTPTFSVQEDPPPHHYRRHIYLYSPARSIENILLAESLHKALGRPCTLISKPHIQAVRYLLIIDCNEVSPLRAQTWLAQNPNDSEQQRCVLINATRQSAHEKLIEWPQVKGIFYHDLMHPKLLQGIRAVLDGELWFARHLCDEFFQRRRRAPHHRSIRSLPLKITRRERQVLEGIYSGHSNSVIAEVMQLSEHTIKSHIYSMYKKIGVKSRLEASIWLRDYYGLLDELTID